MWRLLLLFAAILTEAKRLPDHVQPVTCTGICPAIYQPICTLCSYGGVTTFGNECELSRQNSCNANDQCIKLYDGQCLTTACDVACVALYQPVCALCDNGEETTFGNDCELGRQNICDPSNQCTKVHEGECKEVNPGGPLCLDACIEVYKPVCAQCPNGSQTFSNACFLQQHNCQTGEECTLLQDGACESCQRPCPYFDIEVCAICNDNQFRTFANTCLMEKYNCENNDNCRNISQGVGKSCPSSSLCPDVCPDNYKPVCAQCPNGKQTFSNTCYLRQHSCQTGEECTFLQEGACENCTVLPCPFSYNTEVCAICNDNQFRTFPNTCFMKNYNCENNDNCRYISHGDTGMTCPPELSSCDHIFCPAIQQPVCARCGQITRSFQNGCALGVYNCNNNLECVKISDGECPAECSNEREPVCATCSTGVRTFQNKCTFDSHNTLNPQDPCTLNYESECHLNCPLYKCTDVKNPICALCGTEERTYDNECIFESYNCLAGNECSKLHNGQCHEVNPGGSTCPAGCTKEYRPICAQCSNGQQTFANLCLLQQNNCQSRGGCTYLRNGECTPAPKPGIQVCPLYDVQVCAVCANNEYRTFPNKCIMNNYNSRTNENCQYVSQGGTCPPISPVGPVIDPNPRNGFPTDPSQCAAITCSAIHEHVCARCGYKQSLQTFQNRCLLGIHNCFNNQECTEISGGACQGRPSPIICSIQRDPVCASCSGGPRTFPNKCFFNSYQILNPQDNCTQLYDGKCQTTCPLFSCLLVKKPICALCGFEQRTFDNECIFNSYNCPAGFECTKLHDGLCSSVPPLICTGEYKPVCASCSYGLETFVNKCFLNAQNLANPNANCVQRSEGPCATRCPLVNCLNKESPVCGLCGNTKIAFSNEQ